MSQADNSEDPPNNYGSDYYYTEYGEEYEEYGNYGEYEETYNYEDASEGICSFKSTFYLGEKFTKLLANLSFFKIGEFFIIYISRWPKSGRSIIGASTSTAANHYYHNY